VKVTIIGITALLLLFSLAIQSGFKLPGKPFYSIWEISEKAEELSFTDEITIVTKRIWYDGYRYRIEETSGKVDDESSYRSIKVFDGKFFHVLNDYSDRAGGEREVTSDVSQTQTTIISPEKAKMMRFWMEPNYNQFKHVRMGPVIAGHKTIVLRRNLMKMGGLLGSMFYSKFAGATIEVYIDEVAEIVLRRVISTPNIPEIYKEECLEIHMGPTDINLEAGS